MKLSILLAFCAVIVNCHGARILGVTSMAAKSHAIIIDALINELHKRGHEITYITPFPRKKPVANLTEISTNELYAQLHEQFDLFQLGELSPVDNIFMMNGMSGQQTENFFALPQIKKFIQTEQHFDLIVSEGFLNEAFICGLSQKFKAPNVQVQMFLPNIWANYRVGNPDPSSYIPDTFLGYYTKMNFWERLQNHAFVLFHELSYRYSLLPEQDQIMRREFGLDYPPLQEILKNTSVVLVNHHFSLAYPRPYVPNMIEIGGMHVSPTPKKLPQDIRKFLDEAEHGAIYFSLGSNAQSSKMPQDRLNVVLEVLGRLKQKVLWKWETDELPGKPDNVMIGKWLPQSDILAHPNVKLFITHGGLLSTTESVYRGVPIVGLPIFAEQPLNMEQAQQAGFGRKVDFRKMTADDLHEAILEVIENPKYLQNVQLRSKLLKDTPQTSMERAMFWIEYVLRHKGASHMRSSAQDLSWIQLHLLDVYAVLLLGTALVLHLTCLIVKRACRLIRRSKKVDNKKKTN